MWMAFCCSVFAILKTYCDATLLLLRLDVDLRLPAMAHLRIISELTIRFLWCLNVKKNEEIGERIERWEKTGVKERKKLVEELLESKENFDSETVGKFQQELSNLDKYLKDNVGNEMPHVTGKCGLFEQTENIFERNICAQAYRQFNPAVHVDPLVLTWSTKRKGSSIYYTGDLDENIDSLKIHCLSFSYMVIEVLYFHYHWRYDQIEREYHEAVSNYTKKEQDGK